ncbi:MAG TPA: MarR family transcriptional regulator [Chloroflexota bacterium]|nr:MarR family transcriptional regulator [Chloroflexota bacterium]
MKVADAIDAEALRTLGTMLKVVRSADRALREASRHGLGLTEVSVLAEISRGTTGPSSLADALRLDRPRITRLTDRLVCAELVARQGDDVDRRRFHLTITQQGEGELHASLSFVADYVGAMLRSVPSGSREGLVQGLLALRSSIEDKDATSGASLAAVSLGR